MKSEERHQLLTNDLQVVTTKTVGFFEQHAITLGSVAAGVLLFAAIGFWWTSAVTSESAAGWTLLDSAQSLQDFGDVADKFRGKPPGQWAQLKVAEKTLETGLPLMFTNRELGLADLKQSREGFEGLLQEKTAGPIIRERALWGLALCLEATCDGNTSKAIEAFERLKTEFPETMFLPVAEDRIASLKKESTKEFYTWFSKENPKPPDVRPNDMKKDGVDLPSPKGGDDDDDDFPMKKGDALQKPSIDKPEVPEKKPELPAADEKPAAENKAEAPAKPAEGEKPAEKK